MTAPSNANTSGLAPCPFCGGAPSVRQAMGETWVVCGSCAASTQSKGRESVALDLWNRRVTAASAQARIDAAEARADRLAKALEALEAERKREGVNLSHLKRAVAVAYADMNRAALQQEKQP